MSSCYLLNSALTLSSPSTYYQDCARVCLCVKSKTGQQKKSLLLNLLRELPVQSLTPLQVLFHVKFDVNEFRWRKHELVRLEHVYTCPLDQSQGNALRKVET